MPSKRKPRLVALQLDPQRDMSLEPAPSDRDWMDASNNRYAYRCLPLVMANQAGWFLRCPLDFSVRWNGGPNLPDLKLRFPRGCKETGICSHFGQGILTFTVPYLFRTPRGINLWVKGPTNSLKDGIQPLEGIVETDWNNATFTMNWKVTRRNHTIRFEKGEPVCMIVPVPRGLLESFDPVRKPLHANKKLMKAYEQWRESRRVFNEALARNDEAAVKRGWERNYMLGIQADGQLFSEHQTKLKLSQFRQEE